MRFRLVVDGEDHHVEVLRRRDGLLVRVDGAEYRARPRRSDGTVDVRLGGVAHRVEVRGAEVRVDGVRVAVAVRDLAGLAEADAGLGAGPTGTFEVRPPMPGRVVRLPVRPGDRVRRGDPIVVLEAMKMQNEIPAPADAVVREVRVREGESIGADRLIAVLEAT